MQSAVTLPWQQPNATECVAAQTLVATAACLSQGYVAFPWATWIDRARRGCPPELPPSASTSGRWSIWISSSGPASQTCSGARPPKACRTSAAFACIPFPSIRGAAPAALQLSGGCHPEQAVYREQVHRAGSHLIQLVSSGSGPNFIRLWEALGYGYLRDPLGLVAALRPR